MNDLYLSILQFHVPAADQPMAAQDVEWQREVSVFSLKQYLFPSEASYREMASGFAKKPVDVEIPVLPIACFEAVINLIKTIDVDMQKMELLMYCHETLEPTFVLPSLKIKHLFDMKSCLPLMISQNGSLSSLNAITLARASISSQKSKQSFIIVADRVEFPSLRYQFNGFMRGDHVSLLHLSQTEGDYEVLDTQKIMDCIDVPYPLWNEEDYRRAEQNLIAQTIQLLQNALSLHKDIEYIIGHQISTIFSNAVELWCEKAAIRLLSRKQWEGINLQGSDPYISLKKLEEENQFPPNCKILLLFASIDFGVGYTILLNIKDK